MGEAGMQYLIYKKEDKVEIQLGPFGDINLPIQTTMARVKTLDGKFDYIFANNKSGLFILALTVEASEVSKAIDFLVQRVLIFPDEHLEHFNTENPIYISTMRVDRELCFDASKEVVTVKLSKEQRQKLGF